MNQRLYGIWLGEVMFCFSGEISEAKVDAWTAAVRRLTLEPGIRPFQRAALRLAEVRYPVVSTAQARASTTERKGLIGRSLEGLALSVQDTWEMLLNWDGTALTGQQIQAGGEMEFWSKAAQFALDLLLRGKIAPGIRPGTVSGRRRTGQASAQSVWVPSFTAQEDEARFRQLAEAMPPICLAAVQFGSALESGSILNRRMTLLYSFLTAMIDNEVRRGNEQLGRNLYPVRARYRRGYSPMTELWWNELLGSGIPSNLQGPVAEISQMIEEITDTGGVPPRDQAQDYRRKSAGSFRLCLRIEPEESGEEELASTDVGNNQMWKLSFWAEGVEDPRVLLPAGLIWSYPKRDMEIQEREYRNVQQNLLLRLSKAAYIEPVIKEAMGRPHPESVILHPQQLYTFLSKSVSMLRKQGVTVQMPTRWTKEGRRRVGVRLKVDGWSEGSGSSQHEASKLGIDKLVQFEAEVLLNESPLSYGELAELASSKSSLVLFRGEWIEIDAKEIRQVLKFMKRQETGEMSFRELMHLSADDGYELDGILVEAIEAEGMLSLLLSGNGALMSKPDDAPVPSSLNGTLRPYQERGFRWLASMRQLGFGALLADDMGLGKTVQVISVLLEGLEQSAGPTLIVCPTSLLGNWQREFARFAPQMRLCVHHGSDRLHGEKFFEACQSHDIVLTTYQLTGRDAKEMREVSWSSIVLDEAQYIKNFGTKQAQSVMKLNSGHKIAMTGTPVENRLTELWSIFQFLNPGYLGSNASFRSRFTGNGVGQNAELIKLRKLIAPFLLRRLKSDPDIRKDLPEKIELKSYCSLTTEQARLYQAVTDGLMERISSSEGIARKGIVLSSLTQLKQICDHPHLTGARRGAATSGERSGKLDRLFELLDLILDNKESALIFTQYVQMGDLLQEQLLARYGEKPFFLHGGVAKLDRDHMVHEYQEGAGSPLFVLSLKAGGVGLNLTRANHVIHYDRWWNPAVENQATDRVFRIGQQKNVEVHKLICQGTLEERIDELIERKRALSEQVVGSGEHWLTEMSNEELQNLIALQGWS
ncbi:MAG TPA: DEAD/DEAH box helicase [Paenibacillus sp.]